MFEETDCGHLESVPLSRFSQNECDAKNSGSSALACGARYVQHNRKTDQQDVKGPPRWGQWSRDSEHTVCTHAKHVID